MCGICGVHSAAEAPDPGLVRRMLGVLAHRGPDGSGYYRDERVALGHTRLAIVDTVGGVQPMGGCDEAGEQQVWVTFNGEIFNHVELAADLRARGHRFRTRSDTEVIVHAWEEWGPGCFDRFNGQWALAVWDRRSGDLVLARDRFGVRPLFYTRSGGKLLFASEVKALFADPDVPRELDPAGIDQVLTLWSTVAPQTVFRGVRQVPPGSYLTFPTVLGRSAVASTSTRFWAPGFSPQGAEPLTDLAANAEALRERLVAATRLRFERSDVPVAAYLSGGIDSAVTAGVIAAERIGHSTAAPLHTFSLRFADDEFDEGGYQALMAKRLGTVHEDVVVRERDIAEVFPDVVRHAESPLLRTGPAPMFLLSRLVRQSGFKVVVTGEGSDEVLGGYDIFREGKIRELWTRDPAAAEAAVEQLYPWMKRSPHQAPAFAKSFFGRNLVAGDPAISHRPRWDSTSVLRSMLTPAVRAACDRSPADEVLAVMPAESARWDPLSRAQWLEMTTLLPGYILASQGDRMLMGNSIEGRFPFLDPHVAELAGRVPADHKIHGMDEKHLLKIAFADLVPEEILRRPKQPYRAPDAAAFFAGGTPDWVGDVTSVAALEAAGMFRPELVQRLLEKARRTRGRGLGNTDNMRLVAVLSTQLLHSELITGSVFASAPPPEPLTVFDHTLEPIGRTPA
ncbi:asparagine synthase (glutamine-hydrolyzing) [Nocardioides luteus]|uniref:asparagine synthase (glutamine-hydrolyzing) n=1 Tax=Nocardioides luteus TaxID=1844 RepID=A0ABQ5SUD0_9ACTN|nr:asparagine synthase (glutamine-hydrolyzing) [Nocardioides luteus]MDR7309235.1 asparagine synthase (glutamine-hydrolyzing) [Nocardioides luteus]GGR48889.1 asparagine synthase (glutamine-hydrolyzing) [Nocardioides luteus]GLJ67640.1 asparagine synthase (glutamine-hydrolyzing) [Nocardioides luteus]